MFRQIDESKFLLRIVRGLSNFLATQRGIPVLVAVVLIVISSALEIINISVQSPVLAVLHIVLQGFGIITALLGILLSEALSG